eukprot:scaffold252464_cov19-Tisochrysis_lutea.AAC.1
MSKQCLAALQAKLGMRHPASGSGDGQHTYTRSSTRQCLLRAEVNMKQCFFFQSTHDEAVPCCSAGQAGHEASYIGEWTATSG